MSTIKTGNAAHDAAVSKAESIKQATIAPGAAGTPGVTVAAVRNADVAFHRAVLSSAVANGANPTASLIALRELGIWGLP